jgi:hypothetical protein
VSQFISSYSRKRPYLRPYPYPCLDAGASAEVDGETDTGAGADADADADADTGADASARTDTRAGADTGTSADEDAGQIHVDADARPHAHAFVQTSITPMPTRASTPVPTGVSKGVVVPGSIGEGQKRLSWPSVNSDMSPTAAATAARGSRCVVNAGGLGYLTDSRVLINRIPSLRLESVRWKEDAELLVLLPEEKGISISARSSLLLRIGRVSVA